MEYRNVNMWQLIWAIAQTVFLVQLFWSLKLFRDRILVHGHLWSATRTYGKTTGYSLHFLKKQCFSKNNWQAKIETEDSADMLFLHFIHHTHNPKLHPFPSHRFLIPYICKWRGTKNKFETLLEPNQGRSPNTSHLCI